MKKKIVAMMLVLSMVLSMCACGQDSGKESTKAPEKSTAGTEDTGSSELSTDAEEKLYYNKEGWYPICDEEITITVSGRQGTTKDWSKTLMAEVIKEEMGINMDITTHSAEIWPTQLALMLADDNLPDLVLNGPWDKIQSNEAGKDGFLLNLADYLDIMPNFAKFLEENPEYKGYTMTDDGEIFGIAGVKAARNSNNRNMIHVSYADMEKYGFTAEDISSVEGLYEVLKKIKAQDPDKIPFGMTLTPNSPGTLADVYLQNAFGIYSTTLEGALGVENDKVVLYDATNNYKEYLKYMNRLYTEELIDQDLFILTKNEYHTKTLAGDYVFMNSQNGLTTMVGAQDATILRDYYSIAGFKSDLTGKSVYVYKPLVSEGTSIYVNANTKYPEAICRLIDYLFTDEGYIFFNFGIEGKSFVYEDDGFGNRVPNDSALFDASTMPYANKSDWKWQANVINGVGTGFARHPRDLFITNASEEDLVKIINSDVLSYIDPAAKELAVRQTCDEWMFTYPALKYTEEEAERRAILMTDLATYIETMKPQFIRGEIDIDKEWEGFVKKMEQIGLKELLSIEQAAYDRYKVNLD